MCKNSDLDELYNKFFARWSEIGPDLILLSHVRADLKARQSPDYEKRPLIKPDYKNKKISVEYWFGPWDTIKVRLRATYETWLRLWNHASFDRASFRTMEPLLSRNRKEVLVALRQYAEEFPEHFQSDLLFCVQCANARNPLFPATKERGGSPYGFSFKKMTTIRQYSKSLYAYIRFYRKHLIPPQPLSIEDLYELYGIDKSDRRNISKIVQRVIENHFQVKFTSRFYRTFVLEGVPHVSKLYDKPAIVNGIRPEIRCLFGKCPGYHGCIFSKLHSLG